MSAKTGNQAGAVPTAASKPTQQPPSIVRVRHYGRWLSGLVLLVLVVLVVIAFAGSDGIDYSVIASALFGKEILQGVLNTLLLTVLAMLIGIVGGFILAGMWRSHNPVAKGVAGFYIWFMRGTPVLVQLVFWFNISIVFPSIGPCSTNELVTPFVAALFGLGLNEAAWMAEVVRGGIVSVDKGQAEAAHALGMTRRKTLTQIILPQAIPSIIPPTGNEVLNMLKATALASVISYTELLQSAQSLAATNVFVIEMLIVASIWYLAITTILGALQSRLERRYARSTGTVAKPRLGLMRTSWKKA